ncbi:Crp/Fnr family transcriptional regulator [Desulfonema ishimotonii]|uniref:Crp/Fnr family transcriptional regulator n=1 Tax=Desulfonema ishimotonii TaxID=45657 RepID=A0A401FZR1_9BACT|nr:Crp/Fnr family transcriptional regulator [Desulfonema ishimotonii]GBC62426.1 Crp/Fnr family transcriptional regulator [Desulfonema ishimotonii]
MNSFRATDKPSEPENGGERSELVENLEALRRLPIFSDIPFEIIRLYAYTAKRRHFRQGEVIFRQGERASRAYLVLSGRIQLFMEKEGKRFDLQALDHRGFFGYMSLLSPFEWPLSSQALADSEVLMLERESFRKILTRYPEQCLLIVEKLVQMRMRRMTEHMHILMDHIEDKGQLTDVYRIE